MDKNIYTTEFDERIESFLRGEMSQEEEAAFKQEVKSDPDLKKRAIELSSLIKEIRNEKFIAQSHLTSTGEKHYLRSAIMWIGSIAALFVLFFGIQRGRHNSALFDAVSPYQTHYDINTISRGDADSVLIGNLYALFNQVQEQQDMSKVIPKLQKIYESLETEYTYYPYANDISWNLALAYIKNDQVDDAKIILKNLIENNPDTPISNKAKELLKAIESL